RLATVLPLPETRCLADTQASKSNRRRSGTSPATRPWYGSRVRGRQQSLRVLRRANRESDASTCLVRLESRVRRLRSRRHCSLRSRATVIARALPFYLTVTHERSRCHKVEDGA